MENNKPKQDNDFKNIQEFANYFNLKIVPINYKGFNRKGYDLVDVDNYIQLSIEPREYNKDSVYSKDKWFISDYTAEGTSVFYVKNINEIPKILTNFTPKKTGHKLRY